MGVHTLSRFWRGVVLATSAFLCAPPAIAQVAEGVIFGHRIGKRVEGYEYADLRQELFSWPFVLAEPEDAAAQFDRLRLIVTPVTGTLVAVLGIAEFETPQEARDFGARLQTALWARFGPSLFLHTRELCEPIDAWRCTHHPRDTALHLSRHGEFALRLTVYATKSVTPAVHLGLAPIKGSQTFFALDALMTEESATIAEQQRRQVLEEAEEGVLRGVD
ncbi:hypothetical protein ATO8_09728 [Roseivivax marinus]|uniref:Lipoprotein n=1 Tax=Roseivivax marinus TaxID=1379903 RepID=W4HK65_9RHOB|nr:hypothetical protein [Roseivivax marinus]ETW12813.1 hypothetical protein ATO8_09728 [Roseivivax marinus]